jgi:hypothetical protein
MAILENAPEGAKVLDLAAARAAREEARAVAGEPVSVIKLEAGYIQVNPEVDILSAEAFSEGRIREGLAQLLADPEDIDVITEHGVSAADLQAIVNFITGVSLGE